MVAAPASKLRLAPVEFTMDDLIKRLDDHESAIKGARGDIGLQAAALQRIENAIKNLGTLIGIEEEDGSGGYKGTGIVGRTRRNEAEVRALKALYHRWIAFGAGFCASFGIFVAAVWWIVGDKIAIVLKGTGHG